MALHLYHLDDSKPSHLNMWPGHDVLTLITLVISYLCVDYPEEAFNCNDECSAVSVWSKKSQVCQKKHDMATCSDDLTCCNQCHADAAPFTS